MATFSDRMYELIVRTSTQMAPDVMQALAQAKAREDAGTRSGIALSSVAINTDMARTDVAPICQDTGMPTFEISYPAGVDPTDWEEGIHQALRRATEEGILRPNSVHSITGKNEGNLGTGYPVVKYHPWKKPQIQVRLVLKGGGSENTNAQYSLPAEIPGLGKAGRDLDGVRKAILHAVWAAQGKGCSPGFVGVCIGGDRAGGYEAAKGQLFRNLLDTNPDPKLAALEEHILKAANTLGIGTMGFGGESTLLGCKVTHRNRLPASFFVSVVYNCWAFRRQAVHLDPRSLEIVGWDFESTPGPTTLSTEADHKGPPVPPRKLRTPLSEEDMRSLKVGDVVLLSGMIYTGRDSFHAWAMNNDAPVDLNGSAIYHCGPVMVKREGQWQVNAAGPTTSIREEPYQADVLKKYGLRAVIGKGGMGARTLKGLQEHGAVYFSAVGGAAQHIARCVRQVKGVDLLEFGVPEAVWHLEVEDLPLFVTMDAAGNSLHADVEKSSLEKLQALAPKVF